MPVRRVIQVSGGETPQELAKKINDIQRIADNRITALEKQVAELEELVEEIQQ